MAVTGEEQGAAGRSPPGLVPPELSPIPSVVGMTVELYAISKTPCGRVSAIRWCRELQQKVSLKSPLGDLCLAALFAEPPLLLVIGRCVGAVTSDEFIVRAILYNSTIVEDENATRLRDSGKAV